MQLPEKAPNDSLPKNPVRPEMEVRSDVDAYVTHRGRDSREHEQLATNYGREIEEEFERRAAEARQPNVPEPEIETDRYGNEIIDIRGPVDPGQSCDEPPPLEPDRYVPDRQPPPPEHDFDFEMGD